MKRGPELEEPLLQVLDTLPPSDEEQPQTTEED